MKKIIMLLIAASLFFTPLTGIVAYADEDIELTETTEVVIKPVENETLTLTLQEAIDYALLNNKELEIQKLELAKAEVSYKENKNAIKKAEDGAKMLDRLDIPRTYEVTPDQIVNKALIDKGVSEKQNELALLSANMNLEMKENQIKYNVEKAYFDLLQKQEELRISGENLALSQKQYNNSKLRYDLGMISKQQLLGIELGLSQAQSGYDAAEMIYEIQLLSFKRTLGLPLEKGIKLTSVIEVKEYEPIDLEESIKLALENNAGVIISKENAVIQPLILEATSGRFPPITFRYRKQETEVAKAEENLQQAKLGVEMGVRTSILNLKTAEEQ
ncbi:MAG: TolC family protein, partial [Tissierellia bacterium]|nr:TolC family protein [Tissierellia bacterium]